MNKTENQLHQEMSLKTKRCLTFSLTVISLLSITKMILSNRASNWGNQLKEINNQITLTEQHNLYLKGQLAQKIGGLNTLAETAYQNGFIDKPQYKYFNSGDSVAQVLP